jgi:hypothetical protein
MSVWQVIYVAVVVWLVASTMVWGIDQVSADDPESWRNWLWITPLLVGGLAAIIAAIGGLIYLLCLVGVLLG